MEFNIYTNTRDWAKKEAEYHNWMKANIKSYKADCWAKIEWCKHPEEDKWHIPVPLRHRDKGISLTKDWIWDTKAE